MRRETEVDAVANDDRKMVTINHLDFLRLNYKLLLWITFWIMGHFGLSFVNAIQCYTCDAAHFNYECNSTEHIRQCPITYDTCITLLRYSSEVRKLQISKRCSKKESCRTQSKALELHAPCDPTQTEEWACAHCCGTDLCNHNAGNGRTRLRFENLTVLLLNSIFPLSVLRRKYSS